MALTRFKDDRAGYDGPVSGSLQLAPITMSGTGAATDKYKIDLPPGMRFRVTNATFRASAIGGTPTLAIGTVNNATALVATANLSTNLGALTVKAASANFAKDAMLIATLTLVSATGAVRAGVLTLTGHVSDPPTSVIVRNASHF